jgi:hypothetical protein
MRIAPVALTLSFALVACPRPPAPPAATTTARVAPPSAVPDATAVTIRVNPALPIRKFDKRLLLGTNIAIWHRRETFADARVQEQFGQTAIGLIRMPGGSASDQYFWNGNGVRSGNEVDRAKYDAKAHRWAIDYSDWKPGFNGFWGFPSDVATAKLEAWHGHVNVKDQHEFIARLGAQAVVTVNAGTGTPRDAAEWVRWAKKMQYDVRYWEIGNELGGDWESGTLRPDGTKMDGALYGKIYADFARAMKQADPAAQVGSQGGVDFIEGALGQEGVPVDFVTFHDYYNAEGNSPAARFKTLDRIRGQIREVREAIEKHRPGSDIPIGITEYNCKLFEDAVTSDVFSGLWTVAAIGEMLYGGLDFATQWDAFTQKQKTGGGHGFMIEQGAVPKAEYWALYLMSHSLGSELLPVEDSSDALRTYASRDAEGAVHLIVVNTSEEEPFRATIDLGETPIAPVAHGMRFSYREYAWDPDGFAPLYNNGPTRFAFGIGAGAELVVPPFSAVSVRFDPPTGKPLLAVRGPAEISTMPGHPAPVVIEAFDAQGKPAADVTVHADLAASSLAITPETVTTDADGRARFTVSASGVASGQLHFAGPGFAPASLHVQAVTPTLLVYGPDAAPREEPPQFLAAARYTDGEHQRLLNTFDAAGSYALTDGASNALEFTNGFARFRPQAQEAGAYTVEVTAGALRGQAPLRLFDTERENVVLFPFDDAELPETFEGKGEFRVNQGVRANQGVLEIIAKDVSGWTQDVVNITKLDQVDALDRANVVALSVDVMRPEQLELGGGWASLIFVLQSHDNYWMPLGELKLGELTPGEWKHVELPLTEAQQASMMAFFKIVTVLNSGDKTNGSLFLDNLGFVVNTRKQ